MLAVIEFLRTRDATKNSLHSWLVSAGDRMSFSFGDSSREYDIDRLEKTRVKPLFLKSTLTKVHLKKISSMHVWRFECCVSENHK